MKSSLLIFCLLITVNAQASFLGMRNYLVESIPAFSTNSDCNASVVAAPGDGFFTLELDAKEHNESLVRKASVIVFKADVNRETPDVYFEGDNYFKLFAFRNITKPVVNQKEFSMRVGALQNDFNVIASIELDEFTFNQYNDGTFFDPKWRYAWDESASGSTLSCKIP